MAPHPSSHGSGAPRIADRVRAFRDSDPTLLSTLAALRPGAPTAESELLSYEQARARSLKLDFSSIERPRCILAKPRELLSFPVSEIARYLDWSKFFVGADLSGEFPQILHCSECGERARELYAYGQELLLRILRERRLHANAVYGFWPASSDGDDLVLWRDETRSAELARLHCLRQQKAGIAVSRSLSDYVAPVSSDRVDYVGAFAVTAGIGAEELARHYSAQQDDYRAGMVRALAGHLSNAFAELLHERMRAEWGYGRDESFTHEQLFAGEYRGLRAEFGQGSGLDVSERGKLLELLSAASIGVSMRDGLGLVPRGSVAGLCFAHPEAHAFELGAIGQDQVQDYARRQAQALPSRVS